MKKYFALLVIATFLAACSSTKLTPKQKAEKAAQKEQTVFSAVKNKKFVIYFNYMTPFRGSSRAIDYGYSVKLSGDSIYSSLPYFGVAQVAPYNGGNPLSFAKTMENCNITQGKNNSLLMEIVVKNDNDQYHYVMTVFNNGKADLRIQCQNRDPISFSGELETKRL